MLRRVHLYISSQLLRKNRRGIQSLSPSRLETGDFLDLSGRLQRHIPVGTAAKFSILSWYRGGKSDGRFPPETAGFLYYSVPPVGHPLCGEVRFRITKNQDPRSFADGVDLLLPTSRPWAIPLSFVARCTAYQAIAMLLKQQNLVEPSHLEYLRDRAPSPSRDSAILHSLGQHFYHDLSCAFTTVWVSSGNAIHGVGLTKVLRDGRISQRDLKPYKGSAILGLEHVRTSNGLAAIAFRVHKIIDPPICTIPGYDGYIPPPKEGSLLARAFGETAYEIVINPANKSTSALGYLLPSVSSAGYISHPSVKRPSNRLKYTITNLDPTRIRSGDFVDISGQVTTSPLYRPEGGATTLNIPYVPNPWLISRDKRPNFPLGTHGFFYIHCEDPSHPGTAQLRFRVTRDSHPDSFALGHDLTSCNGLPWARPLPILTRSRPELLPLLISQGLVDQGVVPTWQTLRRTTRRPIIHRLGEAFHLKFSSSRHMGLWVAEKEHLHDLPVRDIVQDSRLKHRPYRPYEGSAICRFERGTSAEGNPCLQLRVLKVIDPMVCVIDGYDGYVVQPSEGSLLLKNFGQEPASITLRTNSGFCALLNSEPAKV